MQSPTVTASATYAAANDVGGLPELVARAARDRCASFFDETDDVDADVFRVLAGDELAELAGWRRSVLDRAASCCRAWWVGGDQLAGVAAGVLDTVRTSDLL
jgi:hypothetical protein